MLNNANLRRDLQRALRTHKGYEASESGIFLPAAGVNIAGHFEAAKNDDPWDIAQNIVVTEGLTNLLGVALAGVSADANHYIAPFSGAVTPVNTWTAANWVANATEITTTYDETARVLWNYVNGTASIGNAASPAVFTFNASVTARGAALVSVATKGATTGKLIAAARFSADKAMADDEELRVKYIITATSS